MSERRTEPRLLCADLVKVQWYDEAGNSKTEVMNLEDISLSGACLQAERPVPKGTQIRILYRGGELPGTIEYCNYQEIGYFLGVEFVEGCQWPSDQFKPQHLFNPLEMVHRVTKRTHTIH